MSEGNFPRIYVNKAPPIDQRPRCPQCKKPLRPRWHTIKEENVPAPVFRRYTLQWRGDYHGYGHFCTLRCTDKFANAIINQRRKKA